MGRSGREGGRKGVTAHFDQENLVLVTTLERRKAVPREERKNKK